MSKQANTFSACSGSDVEYIVKITNIGNDIGKNLIFTDTLPSGFTYATSSDTFVFMNLGDIASYETKTISYSAHVAATTAVGAYANSALAKIDNGSIPNNSASAQASINIFGPCETPITPPSSSSLYPILSIEKIASEKFINPGGTLNFTIIIKNTGTDTAYSVSLNDILPAGFIASDGITSWDLGDIEIGDSETVTFRARADASTAIGTYENIAKTRASNHNEIQAQTKFDVRKGLVLGESAKFTRLPNTGAGTKMIIYFIANFLALMSGIIIYRKTKVYGFYS